MGQTAFTAGQAWDSGGTPSLKALAAKVLRRDTERDAGGTNQAISCPTGEAALGQHFAPVPLVPADDLDERAALIEYGANVPRRWAEGYAALSSITALDGFAPERWQRIVDAAGAFLDRWASKASECGWSDLDVFGCDRNRPDARFDCMGLVLLLDRMEVVGIDSEGADLRSPMGVMQRFRRRPRPAHTVALWDLSR